MTVELRPWTLEDAPALWEANRQSPDLKTQFGGVDLATVDQARDYIGDQLSFTEFRRNWAITIDGAAVGNVGLSAIDRRHGTAWTFYWLASAARGRGPASCKVASSAGFIPEGIERQKLLYGAERFDVETHARLRTDSSPSLKMLPLSQ